MFAACVAISLHIGAAAVALYPSVEQDTDDPFAGRLVVELAPVLTSALLDIPAAPPGVLSTDQAASQPRNTETTPLPETPVEQIVPPAPIESEPDLAVPQSPLEAKPIVEKKPTEQEPSKSETEAVAATDASHAAAPPKLEAPKSTVPTAPDVGVSPLASRAKVSWNKLIAVHLDRFKRYPQSARSQAVAGTVLVEFTIGRNGQINVATVVQSSGSRVLDDAALDMLIRAAPLPPAPPEISGRSFTLTVPIIFRVP